MMSCVQRFAFNGFNLSLYTLEWRTHPIVYGATFVAGDLINITLVGGVLIDPRVDPGYPGFHS